MSALIDAATVRPGDVVHFNGHARLIVDTSERNGFGDPIARDATGWGMTLCGWLDESLVTRAPERTA